MKKGAFGVHGIIHEKDQSGFYGAEIAEIGLFTQAKTLKGLSESIIEAFRDLTGSRITVSVDLYGDHTFLLSSRELQSFYAAFLKAVRGDRSYREAMETLGEKSTTAVSRYEKDDGTTPSLSKAIELLQGLDQGDDDHVLAWIPKKKFG